MMQLRWYTYTERHIVSRTMNSDGLITQESIRYEKVRKLQYTLDGNWHDIPEVEGEPHVEQLTA